jgi:hypothetical protein
MAKSKSAAGLLEQATLLEEVLPTLTKLPRELDGKVFSGKVATFAGTMKDMQRVNAERTRVAAEKRAAGKDVGTFIKRVKSSVESLYGDDSTEFKLVGGTRASERKRRSRKAAPVKAAP